MRGRRKMKRKAVKKCRWCGVESNRRCGICLNCADARDELNKRIDAGKAVYVPPERRPGHRFYKRRGRPRTEKQIAAANRLKLANKAKQTAQEMI